MNRPSSFYSASIGGARVRLFAIASSSNGAPWFCVSDLVSAIRAPVGARAHIERQIATTWATNTRRVATADGTLTIAPAYLADGLFATAIEEGWIASDAAEDFAASAAEATSILMVDEMQSGSHRHERGAR